VLAFGGTRGVFLLALPPCSLSEVGLLIPELSGNCSSWKKFLVLLSCAEDLSVPRTGLGFIN